MQDLCYDRIATLSYQCVGNALPMDEGVMVYKFVVSYGVVVQGCIGINVKKTVVYLQLITAK